MKTKEPPYTEPYVRWCGRTVNKIIIYLLPDKMKADELMSGVNDTKDESKKSVAMTMIRRMLETGPILYENILQESEDKINYFLQIEKITHCVIQCK